MLPSIPPEITNPEESHESLLALPPWLDLLLSRVLAGASIILLIGIIMLLRADGGIQFELGILLAISGYITMLLSAIPSFICLLVNKWKTFSFVFRSFLFGMLGMGLMTLSISILGFLKSVQVVVSPIFNAIPFFFLGVFLFGFLVATVGFILRLPPAIKQKNQHTPNEG